MSESFDNAVMEDSRNLAEILGIITGEKPFRSYGYTLLLNPPVSYEAEGEDIEGIGWVPFQKTKTVVKKTQGWYKFKSDAVIRAIELNF